MISLFSLHHWCHFRILAAWVGQLLAKKQTLAMPICSCGSRKPSANPSTRFKGIYTKANSIALQLELNTNTFRNQRKISARIEQQTCFCQSMLRWIFFDTNILKQTHAYVTIYVRPNSKLQLPWRNQLGSPYCAESQHQSSGFDVWIFWRKNGWIMDEGVPLSMYIYILSNIYIYIMHDKNSFRIYRKLHPFGKCTMLQDIFHYFGII